MFNLPIIKNKIDQLLRDEPLVFNLKKQVSSSDYQILKKVIDLDAKRIVYVSCNPATQARDTEQLNEGGYSLKKISSVDQFPHTSHIEAITLFEKI